MLMSTASKPKASSDPRRPANLEVHDHHAVRHPADRSRRSRHRGGAGIGRGIAEGLAAFGASVAIWERDPQTCAAAAEAVGGLGLTTDVRDGEAVDVALQRTEQELGLVSILVNNAGGTFNSPLLETSEKGWDALYRSNLRHVLLCTQRVARRLVDTSHPGSVINVTSIEGARAAPGTPPMRPPRRA